MNGFPMGSIRGVAIRLNWSVAVIATLISWSLADSVFPDLAEGRSPGAYWTAGIITSVLFLATLAAHEVGHAVVALREDVQVRSITLWLFGGVAELDSRPPTAGAAFRIAAAGPAVSGLIGLCLVATAITVDGLVQMAVLWLGVMNLILMAFNLLPAFPLDGGRIYQAWLWHRDGDQLQATNRAVQVGARIGAGMVAVGVLQVVLGAIAGGIWLMAIGWFLREAGRAEWQGAALERPLSTLRVTDIMSAEPVAVAASTSISTFVDELLHKGRHAAYPVRDHGGAVVGIITIAEVRNALRVGTAAVTVGDLTTPLREVVVTGPDTSVLDLLHALAGRDDRRALVFDDERLVGIVAPSDIGRLVAVVELAALPRA
ncbi:MAG: site-2 protease family protein [Actinomycetota bacterium]